MSESSDRSDDKLEDKNNDLISFDTQTEESDQNSGHNSDTNEDNEDFSHLTFPSLLRTHCSFPTELFYTLGSTSLFQLSPESTPVVTNRREPIGGEDRHQLKSTIIQTVVDETEDRVKNKRSTDEAEDRSPLIGRTNSSSESSHSTTASMSGQSVVKQTDSLATKVRQLLGRTKRQSNEEDFESLSLIPVITESFEENFRYITISSQRSEPDGKGRPLLKSKTNHKLVYYSESESEDNEDLTETEKMDDNLKPNNENIENDNKVMRNRSHSASSRTGVKGFDISSILLQRMQTKDNLFKESSETQTNRSFLAERALSAESETLVKKRMDSSKAIQTSDSINIGSKEQKKEVKESSSQTNHNFGISFVLKEYLKSKTKREKVSAGTQTLRSFLTEQALKRKTAEQIQTKEIKTKSIQTSFSSSLNSGSDSPVIERNVRKAQKAPKYKTLKNENKEPISWFISFDSKIKYKQNLSHISGTYSRSLRTKSTPNEQIIESLRPVESLQDAFSRNCVKMRINSQIRVNRINTIADIRKQTADQRLVEMAKQFIRQQDSAKVIKANVIQPVFKSSIRRFFTHEEMRAQTEKIYCNLPEVKAKREKKKQKEREKNQRLLAQFYKYKLKDNALKGRLGFKITQSCLN